MIVKGGLFFVCMRGTSMRKGKEESEGGERTEFIIHYIID
jgi:hypothetical protein